MLLGGVNLAWEYLITGDPLKDIAPALKASEHGEVIVTHDCWQLVSHACVGQVLSDAVQIDAMLPAFQSPPQAIPVVNLPLTAEAALRYESYANTHSTPTPLPMSENERSLSLNNWVYVDRSCDQQFKHAWMHKNLHGPMNSEMPRRFLSRS
jgi:hypothetical protein